MNIYGQAFWVFMICGSIGSATVALLTEGVRILHETIRDKRGN